MHMLVPVLPINLINELPRISVSPNKLVAVSLIVAVDILVFSVVYPLVAGT
jgi:hypothetical protein